MRHVRNFTSILYDDNGIDNEILIFSRIQPELISKASELNFTLNACTMADLKALSDFHVKTVTKDVSKDKLFAASKMIADVPCSGTGTISKNAVLRFSA